MHLEKRSGSTVLMGVIKRGVIWRKEGGYGKGREHAELGDEPLKHIQLSFEMQVLSERALGSLRWLLPAQKGTDGL